MKYRARVFLFAIGITACAGEENTSQRKDSESSGICGGFAGLACASGEYCRYENGSCEYVDLFGACEPIPEVCTDQWEPVCGCDGITYGNACEAAALSISLEAEGACPSS